MIDEELVAPEAFALAVRARASYLARRTNCEPEGLRPYSQLTLLLGVELETAYEQLHTRGLRGAYRWAVGGGSIPEHRRMPNPAQPAPLLIDADL